MNKLKDFWCTHQNKIILTVGGILLAGASFGAGRLSVLEKSEPVVIEDPVEQSEKAGVTEDNKTNTKTGNKAKDNEANKVSSGQPEKTYGKYVASLQGNIYYAATASKAKEIGEEEKVWFDSKEEAEEQGYQPAGSSSESAKENANTENTDSTDSNTAAKGKYVASKSGSKYYLPDCSGVKRIKEENKVWFDTVDEAKAEGYEPAKNCKGL